MALLKVIDAEGGEQTRIVPAQGEASDISGAIAATGVSQTLAEVNADRSGWLFQNLGAHSMTISELGDSASDDGAFLVASGAFFPPPGLVVPVGQITVAGTIGEKFSAREW